CYMENSCRNPTPDFGGSDTGPEARSWAHKKRPSCLARAVIVLASRGSLALLQAKPAAETDRAMQGVPLATGLVFTVSAFAASVWHGFSPDLTPTLFPHHSS